MFSSSQKKAQLAIRRQQLLLEVQQQRLSLFDDLCELQTRTQAGALVKDVLADLLRLGKPAAYASVLWLVKQRWQKTRAAKTGRIAGLVATLWGAWRLAKRVSPWLDLLTPHAPQRRDAGADPGPVRPSM